MRTPPPRTISLFAEKPQARQSPSAFAVSAFVHVTIAGMIAYGFIFAPRINMEAASERYVVRQIELDEPDPEMPQPPRDSKLYPGNAAPKKVSLSHDRPAAPASSRFQAPKLKIADRSIVQPDTTMNKVLMKQTPLPAMFIWSVATPKVQLLTPPRPHLPTTADVKPSVEHPNAATNLADIAISPTPFSTMSPMPVPSSTSPITFHGPSQEQRIPETTSAASNLPSSATVLSLSDLQMKQGAVLLPPANQTVQGTANGSMAPGRAGNSAMAGNGDPSSHSNGVADRPSRGDAGDSAGLNAALNGAGSGNAKPGANTDSSGNSGQSYERSYTRITLPQNGQFGVVVVGSAMQEEFPETARLWGGRLVYSVYLHVGLERSWVLQYSLPATIEKTSAGTVSRLEAPWPYYIVRPNVDPDDVNANALMVHGYVNQSGRFEGLSLVFPPDFAKTQLVLEALQQWRFRPSKHDGQLARVEVLLIIPEGGD
jgi:hypothetical protein